MLKKIWRALRKLYDYIRWVEQKDQMIVLFLQNKKYINKSKIEKERKKEKSNKIIYKKIIFIL